MRHAIIGHLLRSQSSAILDPAKGGTSGYLLPAALYLTHSPMPFNRFFPRQSSLVSNAFLKASKKYFLSSPFALHPPPCALRPSPSIITVLFPRERPFCHFLRKVFDSPLHLLAKFGVSLDEFGYELVVQAQHVV